MTAGVPLWSKSAASNASADPTINWAEGQSPSSVNDSSRAEMAAVAKLRDDLYGLTTGGTSTAFTVTTNSTFSSAADMSGAIFTIIPDNTSGAAPTLAVDGLTARAINVSTGVAVPTGALIAGTPYLVKYVHATTEFIVIGSLGKNLLTSLDIINGTSETAIATGDTLPIYDLSNTANRRMLVSDFLKVISALTADSSPDSAADYVMTYDDSASAAKKVLLSNLPSSLPQGYINGCLLSNGTDATNDINIAAGVCRDATDAVDIVVPAITGKQLDANWAAGGSAGMRNSAAGITNTTYFIFAARTAASSTGDIYAHTSPVAATVLTALQAESGGSDYAYIRRIGAIIRSGDAILAFSQMGDEFLLSVPVRDVNNTASHTTAATATLTVPVGSEVWAILSATVQADAVNKGVLISSFAQADNAPAAATAPGMTAIAPSSSGAGNGSGMFRTNTSGQVRYRANDSSVDTQIYTHGWIDDRGKD